MVRNGAVWCGEARCNCRVVRKEKEQETKRHNAKIKSKKFAPAPAFAKCCCYRHRCRLRSAPFLLDGHVGEWAQVLASDLVLDITH